MTWGQDATDLVRAENDAGRYRAAESELVELGQELYADTSLSGNGNVSCMTCHTGMRSYKDSFKQPYPHDVAMARDRFGLSPITAETMVQMCMVVPMAANPLPWDSRELAALTAYVADERERFAEETR